MTDRPILFSGPMVCALLGGKKTQTRRVLSPRPVSNPPEPISWPPIRFVAGDRLYVREAWRTESRAYEDLAPSDMGGEETILFEADADWGLNKTTGRLRQGMHMPRWASRLTLCVTEVRVQRLKDITEEDARAEGVELAEPEVGEVGGWRMYGKPILPDARWSNARDSYASLWDSLNNERGFGWSTNPWVVAVNFSVQRGNIDQIR